MKKALLLGPLAAVVGIFAAVGRGEPARPVAAKAGPSVRSFAGATSCAAAACHNAGGSSGTIGSEYSTWLLGDPHATRAFAVLATDERSAKMVRIHSGGKATDATRYPLCLKCHTPSTAGSADPSALASKEGVSCEACHGPSQQWRGDHYSRDWLALTPEERQRRGFELTKLGSGAIDLAMRVRKCASCHIGDMDREVDHDLIAAGHPPLFFDYAAHEAIYPAKHWHDPPSPDRAVRAWAIGQVAQALAVVELGKARAERRATQREQVWPEFSAYSCFACHHDLGSDHRREPTVTDRKLGTLPWAAWNMSALEVLAERGSPFAAPDPGALLNAVHDMQAEMERMAPNAAKVSAAAKTLQKLLNQWLGALERVTLGDDQLRQLAHRLRDRAIDERTGAWLNWDAATVHYLGLAACCEALHDRGALTELQRRQMDQIRDVLKFKAGYNSPRDYDAKSVRARFAAFQP